MKLASFIISLLLHAIIIGLLLLLFRNVVVHKIPTYTVSLLTPGEGRAGNQNTIQPLNTKPKEKPSPATILPPKINEEVKKVEQTMPQQKTKMQNTEAQKNTAGLNKEQRKIEQPKTPPQTEIQKNIKNKIQQLKEQAFREKITQLKEALLENRIREIAQQLRENAQSQSGVGKISAQGSGVGNQDKLFSDYLSVVQGIIHSNWFVDQNLLPSNKLVTRVEITISKDGKITKAIIVKSSGNLYYDRTVMNAINNSTLPPVPHQYLNSKNTLDLVLNFFIKD